MSGHVEVISAMLDREPVDLGELCAALEDRGARDALVDFVRVRQALMQEAEDVSVSARGAPNLPGAWASGRSWPRRRALVLTGIAAVVLAGLTGVLVGTQLAVREAQDDEVPQVTRELRFEPGVDWHQSF